jgi:predicted RNA binding protein YcfA (HicA-like mRNA interferase family)
MGFTKSRQKGSHIQYVGFIKKTKRRVTLIADQTHFAPGTIRSMIEQSGLREEDWLSYL